MVPVKDKERQLPWHHLQEEAFLDGLCQNNIRLHSSSYSSIRFDHGGG